MIDILELGPSPGEPTGFPAWPGDLAAAALTFDAPEAALLVERLSTPPQGRRWTALATRDHDGVIFASVSGSAGDLDSHADGASARVGHVDLFAVHPSARRRGIGRALIGAAEEWLRGEGLSEIRFAGNPPCYAWPGIDVRYTPAICLAETLGYERYNVAWNMTADLPSALPGDSPGAVSGDPAAEADLARLAAAGVTVRAAPAGQRAEVIEFVRAHWNDAWGWEVAQASGCHYATRGNEILGFAAWGARPLWFGPMGTAQAAQGLGVGRVLLRRCLAEQAAAGLRSVQIGWVGPVPFYAKAVGARMERAFWLYRRSLG